MAGAKINLTELKKRLKQASKDDLIREIGELYKRFEPVKDYYQVKFGEDHELGVADKYKSLVENEFFPKRGIGQARLAIARKAVMDYKKVCRDQAAVIDVMLFYVEQGVKYTMAYGDINEAFYSSMESMYERAITAIGKAGLKDTFDKRCHKILDDTRNMGWGFHDTLNDICGELYG